MATSDPNRDERGGAAVRATLRVTPAAAADCAVLASGSRGEAIERDVIRRPDSGRATDACRAAVTVSDGDDDERRLVAGAVNDRCICPVFDRHDCVTDVRSFSNGALVIALTLPTRDALRSVVDDLRDRDATVHLERIVPLSTRDDEHSLEIDTDGITTKQRTAIETAVRMGYYETPRTADLQAVADALGVSRSAASQRLNAAEATLVAAFASGLEVEDTAASTTRTRERSWSD